MAVVIYFKPNWLWIDPLCTVLFSVIVFFTTVPVSKECVRVLMEGSPENLDIPHLQTQVEALEHVLGVLELRIWNISESKTIAIIKVLVDRYSSETVASIKKICSSYKIGSCVVETQVFSL